MADPVSPRRVVLVAPLSTGGIGEHVRDLAEGLAVRGHRVTVVAPAVTLDRLWPAGAAGVVALVAAPVGSVHPAAVRRLRAACRGADVVHAHGVRAGALATVAALATVGAGRRPPVVVTWHNAPLGGRARHLVHTALERWNARRADLILAASADLLDRARAAGARETVLAPVATAPRPPAPGPAAPRDAAAAPALAPIDLRALVANRTYVLCVARLHRQKRIDLLIAALAGTEGLHAFVAGDGPLRQELTEQIARTGAPVTLLGHRDDVADLYAQADLAVLPSDWEARPLAVQEALRAGVPTVVTDVGGVGDLVGDAAVIIKPGDATALRQALLDLATDDVRRAELSRRGSEQAATWPTVDNTVDIVENHYLNLWSRMR